MSWWDFRLQRATIFVPGGEPNNGNKHIGSEVSLTADWAHSENVNVGLGIASFQPGGLIQEAIRADHTALAGASGVNPATLAFADLSIRF